MENIAIIGAEFKTATTSLLSRKTTPCEPYQEFGLYLYTEGTWWNYDNKIDGLAHAGEILKSYGITAVFTNANAANEYLDSILNCAKSGQSKTASAGC